MGGYIHCSCIGCLPSAVAAAVGNVVVVGGTFVVVDVVETVDLKSKLLDCEVFEGQIKSE